MTIEWHMSADPDYVVVAQNASDLHGFDPARYESLTDGIALEAIWYDGDGGFDDWDDPAGYNVLTNDMYPGWTQEVLSHLQPLKGVMPIFCVEYAQDVGGQNMASEVYDVLAPAEGFVPYACRRSLQRLCMDEHSAVAGIYLFFYPAFSPGVCYARAPGPDQIFGPAAGGHARLG